MSSQIRVHWDNVWLRPSYPSHVTSRSLLLSTMSGSAWCALGQVGLQSQMLVHMSERLCYIVQSADTVAHVASHSNCILTSRRQGDTLAVP